MLCWLRMIPLRHRRRLRLLSQWRQPRNVQPRKQPQPQTLLMLRLRPPSKEVWGE
nr:MAG TPA: hypothetical protein [Caudoviricetes sp.]